MRDQSNIAELVMLKPDMIGFIFYDKSKRFVGKTIDPQILFSIPDSIDKVGVFVNERFEVLLEVYGMYKLDFLQLHGEETVDLCMRLKNEGVKIIKAFSVDEHFDFNCTKPYSDYCEYFLFDTKGESYGGNGVVFDWGILENYRGDTPFLLSGGVDLDNVKSLDKVTNNRLYGLDVNSKFEIEPGVKDIKKVKQLINSIH